MREALLRAVHEANWEDDFPLLVLADWLEEYGASDSDRDRAEFLRLQAADADEGRQEELLERHRKAWEGPLAEEGDWVRGLYHVGIEADTDLDGLLAAADVWPWLGSLRVGAIDWDDFLGRLLTCEHFHWVHSLSLDLRLDNRQASELAASPGLAGLTSLGLRGLDCGPTGWAALMGSPYLARLRSLSLSRNYSDALPPWLDGLARSPLPPQLARLELIGLTLGDAGAAALATAPLAGLRYLGLQGCRLTAAGARALAGSPHLRRPVDLIIRDNAIGDEGLAVLLDAGLLPCPPRLDLFSVGAGDAGAAALAGCPRLAPVRELTLSFNAVGPDGAAVLAGSPNLTGLTSLDLAYNRLGDAGAGALARSPHLRSLAALDLHHNDIGPAGAVALAGADLPALAELELQSNPLGVEGVRAFLDALTLPALRLLHLGDTRLGDEGAAVVAAAPSLTRLGVLYLLDNRLGDAGARALAESPYLGELERLEVWGNDLTRAGVDALKARFGCRVVLGSAHR